MTAPKYHFNVTGGSGSAERVDMVDNERSVFVNGTYTRASARRTPRGTSRAAASTSIRAPTKAPRATACCSSRACRSSRPVDDVPAVGRAAQRLLPPTFSMDSKNGFELTLPYYFNIAPNRDLTLTPRIISRRGVMAEATFRYLSPSYSGHVYGQLPAG